MKQTNSKGSDGSVRETTEGSPVGSLRTGLGSNNPIRLVHRFGKFVTPAGISPQQALGVHRMVSNDWYPLRDKTGVGKTIQSMYACRALQVNEGIDFALILVQSTLLARSWQRELKLFLPGIPSQRLVGKPPNQRFWKRTAKFVFLSYDLLSRCEPGWISLRNPKDDLSKALYQFIHRRGILVMDDASAVANPESKSFQAVEKLSWEAERRYILNATLMPERPEQAWAQYYLMDHGKTLGRDYAAYIKKYCVRKQITIPTTGFTFWKTVRYKNLHQLGNKIRRTSLARVLDTNVKQHILDVAIVPSQKEKKTLIELMGGLVNVGSEHSRTTIFSMAAKHGEFNRLMNDCISEAAVGLTSEVKLPAKLEMLVHRLGLFGTQCVVWAHNRNVIERAYEVMKSQGVKVAFIHGGVKKQQEQILSRFLNKKIDVLIGSYGVLAVGVNELKMCPYAAYLQPTWKLRWWIQSLGRSLRAFGTEGMKSGEHKGAVVYDRLVMNPALDKYQYDYVESKEKTVQIAEGRAGWNAVEPTMTGFLAYVRKQLKGVGKV